MELLNFEELAEREKIDIFHDNIMKQKAKIIKYDGTSILLNNKKIHSEAERKCLLAEELGHYYYDAYYTLDSDQTFIDKQEYRAKKWKCLACVSRQSILNCFMKRNNKYIRYSRRITSRTKYGAICLQLL